MNIITKRPIEYSSNCDGEYLNLDGSDTNAVRTFQVWASMNHGAQLAADGIYGPLTNTAYKKWGSEWEATQPKKPVVKQTNVAATPTLPIPAATQTDTNIPQNKESVTDKIKTLPLAAKIAIGIVGGALVFLVVWKLLPKSKK